MGDNLTISRQYLEVIWTIALYLSAELYPIIPETCLFTVKKCPLTFLCFGRRQGILQQRKIKLCFHRKQEMNLSVVSYDSFKAQYCQRNSAYMGAWQSSDPAVGDPKYFLMEGKHAEVCSKGERLSLSSKILNNYTFCSSRKKKSSLWFPSCFLNKCPWRETSK